MELLFFDAPACHSQKSPHRSVILTFCVKEARIVGLKSVESNSLYYGIRP
jgi:hypothetical protein